MTREQGVNLHCPRTLRDELRRGIRLGRLSENLAPRFLTRFCEVDRFAVGAE